MRNEHGFTLLEVLIAIAILGVGIMAIMQLFPASLNQSRLAAERTAAATAANSELSRLRALNNSGDVSEWIRQNVLHNLTAIDRAYALYDGWRTTITRTSDSEETYRVTFHVQMLDGRMETFVTYITKR